MKKNVLRSGSKLAKDGEGAIVSETMNFTNTPLNEPVSGTVGPAQAGVFPETAWSAISQARGGEEGRAITALMSRLANYWKPMCIYLPHR